MSETPTGATRVAPPDPAGLSRDRSAAAGPVIPPPAFAWKTRVLLPGVVLAAFGALLLATSGDALRPSTPVRAVAVVLRESTGPVASVATRATGWLEPDPFPVLVPALADGVIAEVLVLEGEAVEAGQVVARLVADDARLGLARAEAELRSRTAEREAALRTLETLVESRRAQEVSAAAAEEARAAVAAAKARVAMAAAELAERREDLERDEIQRRGDAVPEFTVVRSRLRRDAAEAALEEARAEERAAAARLAEREADARAGAESLRLRIEETRAAERAAAEAALAEAARDEAALRLARMEVRAPVAGTVMRRISSPGSKVMAVMDDPYSSAPVILYDRARLQVRVDVPLADAGRVGVGTAARVRVEPLPDRVFEGRVTRVVHEADLQKNTVQFKVRVEGPAPEMKPEMLARVEFLGAEPAGGTEAPAGGGGAPAAESVWAPESALEPAGDGKARAWAIEGGRAVRRSLVLGGGRREGWVEVREGLLPGDRVIDGAPAGLAEGARVRAADGGGGR